MQLHHDAETVILPPQREQQRGLELLLLESRRDLAREPPAKDRLDLRFGRGSKGHDRQSVVRDAAAERDEEGQPLLEHADKLRKAFDPAQTGEIVGIVRPGDGKRPVGTEGGQHLHAEAFFRGKPAVPFERVRRVVGRAEGFDVRILDQLPRGELFELFAAQPPDLLGRVAVEDTFVAEGVSQLQMAPVVQRIADRKRERLRPFLKLLAVGGAAGDEGLVHARQKKIPVHKRSHASNRSLSIQSPSAGFGMK